MLHLPAPTHSTGRTLTDPNRYHYHHQHQHRLDEQKKKSAEAQMSASLGRIQMQTGVFQRKTFKAREDLEGVNERLEEVNSYVIRLHLH